MHMTSAAASKKKTIAACYDPTYLSKGRHEEAEFTSATGANVVFDFDEGTPFTTDKFPVRAGIPTPSGSVRDDAPLGRYRYHVYPMDGGPGADPTIIVTP